MHLARGGRLSRDEKWRGDDIEPRLDDTRRVDASARAAPALRSLNLRDRNFPQSPYSCVAGVAPRLAWDRSCRQPGPTIFTDRFLNDALPRSAPRRIAWLLEPRAIFSQSYAWVSANHGLFERVWSHDLELLARLPNGRWLPAAGTWIPATDRGVHAKSKLCSFIASNKRRAPGHLLRQRVRQRLPSTVDAFGRGFRELPRKVDGLRDYRFSIAVENCRRDTYFTEKLIDCFLTGTIPIYWGTKRVLEHFDSKGILFFDDVEDLLPLLPKLDEGEYQRRRSAVLQNYELARRFEAAENFIDVDTL